MPYPRTGSGRLIRTKNPAEIEVAEELIANGWEVYKKGWPDFLAVKKGHKPRLIEVKTSPAANLSAPQREVANAFAEYFGIEVELACPNGPQARPKTGLNVRRCYTCKKTKYLSEFGKNVTQPQGRAYECKVCTSKRMKKYFKKKKRQEKRKTFWDRFRKI